MRLSFWSGVALTLFLVFLCREFLNLPRYLQLVRPRSEPNRSNYAEMRQSSASTHALGTSRPIDFGVNFLDGKAYNHHPVMLQVVIRPYKMHRGYLVEVNGLNVPAAYDCPMFNNERLWGPFSPFFAQPSRWYDCWQHYSAVQSGLQMEVPMLPHMEDEYLEMVTIFQSVLRAKPDRVFAFAELGARYGIWASRAASFLRATKPNTDHKLYFAEAEEIHCGGLKEVMKINNLSYSLDCDYANEAKFRAWSETVSFIDVADFDLQNAERQFIPNIIDLLNAKAYRVLIGTHAADTHSELLSLLRKHKWFIIWEHAMATPSQQQCEKRFLRGTDRYKDPRSSKDRMNWAMLLKNGCFTSTPFGPVAHWDGIIIADNSMFVNHASAFSMQDTTLRIDDLI